MVSCPNPRDLEISETKQKKKGEEESDTHQ